MSWDASQSQSLSLEGAFGFEGKRAWKEAEKINIFDVSNQSWPQIQMDAQTTLQWLSWIFDLLYNCKINYCLKTSSLVFDFYFCGI